MVNPFSINEDIDLLIPNNLLSVGYHLAAAKAMDVMGNAEARVWVSAVKAMVPERVCRIIDQAIQMHGATGVSQWTPLAGMYQSQRTLRLADGPDEVHRAFIARRELKKYHS